jgi:hypothetical protein
MRKEVIILIWPNRDAGDHYLIVTIDVDIGDGRTIRTDFFSSLKNLKALDL